MAQHSNRSVQIARAFIAEMGTQAKAAEAVGVRQPSVSRWNASGWSRMRENDLRIRFPAMKVWKKFPPVGVEAR